MIELVVSFPVARTVRPGDRADLFWNVTDGMAAGSIDSDTPVNGRRLLMWSGVTGGPAWGRTPWGRGPWGGRSLAPTLVFTTPPVCFGRVKVGGRGLTAAGTAQSGGLAETEIVVNSTPLPAARLARGTYSGGVQAFTFTPSPNL